MASADELHESFLECLAAACRAGAAPTAKAIRLVARAKDPRLGSVGTRWITLFVPDCHLMSPQAQQQFRYGFGQLRVGESVARAALLRSVFDAGNAFFAANRTEATIATYHLGDFLDLWREGQFEKGVTIDILARRVRETYPWLFPRLFAKDKASLVADLVEGNHDRGMATVVARATRAFAPSFGRASGPRPVLVAHGDVADPVETLEDATAAYFLRRFGKDRDGGHYPVVEPTAPMAAGAIPPVDIDGSDFSQIPPLVNVRQVALDADQQTAARAHEQLAGAAPSVVLDLLLPNVPGWMQDMENLRSGRGRIYKQLNAAGNLPGVMPDLRMVVVGHSHHPRLVAVGEADEPGSFLLMDCGAWIEEVDWPVAGGTKRLPSCQVGVLCGDDARIYQLDPFV